MMTANRGENEATTSLTRFFSKSGASKVKLVRYFDEGSYMYLVFELCEGRRISDLECRGYDGRSNFSVGVSYG